VRIIDDRALAFVSITFGHAGMVIDHMNFPCHLTSSPCTFWLLIIPYARMSESQKNMGEAGAPPQLLGAWLSPGNMPLRNMRYHAKFGD